VESLGNGLKSLRSLRAMRAIRPLKLISKNNNLKIIVNSMMQTFSALE
jgi:hypothetical protein